MKLKNFSDFFIGSALLLSVFSSNPLIAQPDVSAEKYVGRAGDIFISEQEFLQRFEMLPALYRHRKPQIDNTKLELMYSIVAEKLLAQEAKSRNLDRDSLFQHAFYEVRKLLARDQLYREEVGDRVEISDKEITAGIQEARKQVLTSFIFFEREADAKFVREQMKLPKDFDELAIDSSMNITRDTATVIWGDANEAIENVAYGLKVGAISRVVQAGDGFYVIKCLRIVPNTFYSGMQFSVLREKVVRKIRERKEHERMLEFLETAFRNKIGYARPEPLKALAKSLIKIYEQQAQPFDSTFVMTQASVALLQSELKNILNDTLVVVGNSFWSVKQVIQRLLAEGFEVRRDNLKRLPVKLNNEIGYWVQQDLLGQEGLERGLDQRPDVKKQLETWNQAYLADMMKAYARKHVRVSEDEVWKYLQFEDKNVPIPQVQIRELRTNSLDKIRSALNELDLGVPFEQVINKWSNDPEVRRTGGLTQFFPVTERPPLGGIASQMDVGQRYGPIRVADSLYYFELVEKKSEPSLGDTSFAARKVKAAKEMFELKYKKTVSLFLSQIAEKRGYEIYEDRLKKLEVTTIPMLTFRFLGFGGRMFQVPFVDPQTQWLDMDPPKETILP